MNIDVNPIPTGLFLSNIDWEGGGCFPPPHDFALRVEKGECDSKPAP